MHANKHSIYLYNCFLCNIFLLLQRYGEEKKKPPTEEEMLKILAGADKKDWGDLCQVWLQQHQRHSQEVQGDEEESGGGGRPVMQRACTHDTGSNKDEQVWDMIFKKKNSLK